MDVVNYANTLLQNMANSVTNDELDFEDEDTDDYMDVDFEDEDKI